MEAFNMWPNDGISFRVNGALTFYFENMHKKLREINSTKTASSTMISQVYKVLVMCVKSGYN